MPIFNNEGGVIYEHTAEPVNEGGVLIEQDTVHSNEGGVLYEIFSAWKPPELLEWFRGSNSGGKLNSTADNGYTVSFTDYGEAARITRDALADYAVMTYDSGSGSVYLKAGCKVKATVSAVSCSGGAYQALRLKVLEQDGSHGEYQVHSEHLTSGGGVLGQSAEITIEHDGYYYLGLGCYGATYVSSTSYYSATATVSIEITRR